MLTAACLRAEETNSLTLTNFGASYYSNDFLTTGTYASFIITNNYCGTNWLTITNSLRFGDDWCNSYVVCVTPAQWCEMTNAYPDKISTNTIIFSRK